MMRNKKRAFEFRKWAATKRAEWARTPAGLLAVHKWEVKNGEKWESK